MKGGKDLQGGLVILHFNLAFDNALKFTNVIN